MDHESVLVLVPAAEGSAPGAAEDLTLRRAEGGRPADEEEAGEPSPGSWLLLSVNRLGFRAALYEGHKATVKLCKSTNSYGYSKLEFGKYMNQF